MRKRKNKQAFRANKKVPKKSPESQFPNQRSLQEVGSAYEKGLTHPCAKVVAHH
jgi:hypothetical protein